MARERGLSRAKRWSRASRRDPRWRRSLVIEEKKTAARRTRTFVIGAARSRELAVYGEVSDFLRVPELRELFFPSRGCAGNNDCGGLGVSRARRRDVDRGGREGSSRVHDPGRGVVARAALSDGVDARAIRQSLPRGPAPSRRGRRGRRRRHPTAGWGRRVRVDQDRSTRRGAPTRAPTSPRGRAHHPILRHRRTGAR